MTGVQMRLIEDPDEDFPLYLTGNVKVAFGGANRGERRNGLRAAFQGGPTTYHLRTSTWHETACRECRRPRQDNRTYL